MEDYINIYLTPVVQSMIEWVGKTLEANVQNFAIKAYTQLTLLLCFS